MKRVHNFSAGPSTLPLEVLEKAQKEFVCYGDSGMAVMEMSHRSKDYEAIIHGAEATLRELMNIPDNYSVMFVQGGGSTQFAMVPMNLMTNNKKADFVNTGQWSSKAIEEAKLFGEANVIASSKEAMFNYVPEITKDMISKDADYLHLTLNNTIFGTHISNENVPEAGDVPIVADMSSNILAENYDIEKFGLIYAGAQKNLGPAGVTVVIMRKDLIGKHTAMTPTMLRYETHDKNGSMYNTPPTFSIYFAGLVFEWVKAQGGVAAIQKMNEEKAGILYDYLDNSKIFKGTVVKKDRSLMNVPFVLPNADLDAKFIKEAAAQGMVNLKGYRTVGGMRASIYNGMHIDSVKALVDFMGKFEVENK